MSVSKNPTQSIQSIFYILGKKAIETERPYVRNSYTTNDVIKYMQHYNNICITKEEFEENVKLIPRFIEFPEEGKEVLKAIKFKRNELNIAPLFELLKNYNSYLSRERLRVIENDVNNNLIKREREIENIVQRNRPAIEKLKTYILHYHPTAFAATNFYDFTIYAPEQYILDNVCYVCNKEGYYIKNSKNELEAISKETIKIKFKLSNEELENIIINVVVYNNLQEYTDLRKKYFENHKC